MRAFFKNKELENENKKLLNKLKIIENDKMKICEMTRDELINLQIGKLDFQRRIDKDRVIDLSRKIKNFRCFLTHFFLKL
jgi:hypothetical protein